MNRTLLWQTVNLDWATCDGLPNHQIGRTVYASNSLSGLINGIASTNDWAANKRSNGSR